MQRDGREGEKTRSFTAELAEHAEERPREDPRMESGSVSFLRRDLFQRFSFRLTLSYFFLCLSFCVFCELCGETLSY
jgi:hypothetical protein